MIGTYNDEREGDHLDQGNITVDSAFAGEMVSRHVNTIGAMVIRLLEYTKMQTHDAFVAIAKHTAWHPTAGYSQNLTVARTIRLKPGAS